jgi:hypothetical protein
MDVLEIVRAADPAGGGVGPLAAKARAMIPIGIMRVKMGV